MRQEEARRAQVREAAAVRGIRNEQEMDRLRAAQERARQLLIDYLSPEQRREYEAHRWFTVRGGQSGRRYRIHDNGHLTANVSVLEADNDNVVYRLCAHCVLGSVPLHDHLLAQKVTLELDEARFLRHANRHLRE